MTYVTADLILDHVGLDASDTAHTPSETESDWATLCAAAIEGAIVARLDAGAVTPSSAGIDELNVAAITDGVALYNTRAAPNGVLSTGPDGAFIKIGSDSLRAVISVLHRIHPTAGIGIG